jgi:glycosyltransferase involved in cell wall biosynthesis
MQTKVQPPYFTVVIPTHNRAGMLREAIQSVLDQTFTNFELIVIDDHSKDDTAEIVASFADQRLVYILNDRTRGGAGARNAGIFRAKGLWVAFLDDDDVWLPDKLRLQYEKIMTIHKDVGMVYTGHTAIRDDGRTYLRVAKKEGWLLKDLLYTNVIGAFCSVAIRKDLLWAVNGMDEGFPASQDIELYIRLAQLTEIACVEQPLLIVRISHPDRITTNWQNKMKGNALLLAKYRHLYGNNLRLRHRAASRVFVFAMLAKDLRYIRTTILWTLLGVIVDIKNIFWVMRKLTPRPVKRILMFQSKYVSQ